MQARRAPRIVRCCLNKALCLPLKKANELLHSTGKKYPEANVVIDFDNSLSYMTLNVNYPEAFAVMGNKKADMFADTRDQYSQSINETVTRLDNSLSENDVDVNLQNRLQILFLLLRLQNTKLRQRK